MKNRNKVHKISLLHIGLFLILLLVNPVFQKPEADQIREHTKKFPKRDRIEWAIQQEFDATRNPFSGQIPREELVAIYQEMRRKPAGVSRTLDPLVWEERGPNNIAGRTRAILIDKGDPSGNTVLAGSVSGGIWRSTNARSANPVWQQASGFMDNLSIGCLAQHPSNPDLMYAGTGEGFFNVDAVKGNGIWKSMDGGLTWNRLQATANEDFSYTLKLGINASGHLFACTRKNGLMRSTNGGNSWTKVLGLNLGASTDKAADLFIASDGVIFVSMGLFETDGLYRSGDNGNTWTKLSGGLPASGYHRIEIGGSDQEPDLLFALFQDAQSGNCTAIYRTENQGVNWTQLNLPVAFGMNNFTRNQAWYNLVVAVDPDDADRVIIGGIDLFKSENGGVSWTQISQWAGLMNYPYVHADQHEICFQGNSSGTVYFGNDGGIARCLDITVSPLQIQPINTGYNVTQFYGAAIHPDGASPIMLAGAQDNGTQRFHLPGEQATTEVAGGDGSICHIDASDPDVQIATYVFNNYYVSVNGGQSFSLKSFNNHGRFANPSAYDKTSQKLYAANWAGSYFRWNNPAQAGNSTDDVVVSAFGGATVSAVALSPNTPDRLYFGLDNGKVVRVDGAGTGASKAGTVILNGTVGYVSCIAIEEENENHILVTFSNYGITHVKESLNGGEQWTDVNGNLPDFPVRWVVFDPNNSDRALLATELGIWRTDNINGSNTEWYNEANELSYVRVDMLVFRESDHYLAAATHGRGLFTSSSYVTPRVNFDLSQISVNESASAGSFGSCQLNYQTLNIPVSISTNPSEAVTVQFSIESSSTAVNGKDFTLLTSSLSFTPGGNLSKQIQLRILDESIMEETEHINLRITGTAAWIGEQDQLSIQINDNDRDPAVAQATEYNLGQGSTSVSQFPFGGYYEDGRTQVLYRQEEMTSAGMTAGHITQLAVKVTQKNSDAPFNGFNIKIKQTTVEQFPGQGSSFINGATYVYSGNVQTVTGWNVFEFDAPFNWDGQSNLIVDFCYNNADWSDDDHLLASPTPYPSVQYTVGDGSNGCGFSQTGAVSYQRPDIRFYQDQNLVLADQVCSKSSTIVQGETAHFYADGELIASVENLSGGSIECLDMQLDGYGSGLQKPSWMEGAGYSQKSFYIDAENPNPYRISLYFHPSELAAWEDPFGLHLLKTNGPVDQSSADQAEVLKNEELEVELLDNGIIVYRGVFTDFSGFALTDVDLATLPVELNYFEASPLNEGNALRWGYAENYFFETVMVEWRTEGSNSFTSIGSMPRSPLGDMQYIDERRIPGHHYYRLKFLDKEGRSAYSDVRSVYRLPGQEEEWMARIYPNPVEDWLFVEEKERFSETSYYLILDMQGVVVKQIKATPDSYRTKIDGSALKNGVYLLCRVHPTSGRTLVGKFLRMSGE